MNFKFLIDMEYKMNRNKYYRVVHITNNNGESAFIVQASQHWIDRLFNLWPIEYELQNISLDLAIHQIKTLNGMRLIKQKTVFFKKAFKNKNPISNQQHIKHRYIK